MSVSVVATLPFFIVGDKFEPLIEDRRLFAFVLKLDLTSRSACFNTLEARSLQLDVCWHIAQLGIGVTIEEVEEVLECRRTGGDLGADIAQGDNRSFV